ncbi:hypothetical protein AJ78_05787 [Emergomyces pasteurianus Ep9510]|uniref:J domain-containing protein n=1 Tax=Emergomyces pasteurianus Ep9510 TaxID=1447872 RepID=A0A1J9QF46_9EURO|nr:hypothetical protein AJ78_05787 [Emergomyces pasteurianus Ep9510]
MVCIPKETDGLLPNHSFADKILEIDPAATEHQIRFAYKRAALKSHPDRVSTTSPERPAREETFKKVNEAYYVLSDPVRRRQYDNERRRQQQQQQERQKKPNAPPPPPHFTPGPETESASFASDQFGSIFEEMLREEGLSEDEAVHGGGATTSLTPSFWALVGGLSGAALGFIIANFPGALAGAVAGNRLGAVRDARGKSVYEVFQALPGEDKARLLSELAARVLRSAVS